MKKKKSFKEQFERQLKKKIIEVPFKGEDGEEFVVRCRRLSNREQSRILEIHEKTLKIKTSKEYTKLMDEIFQLLAYPKGICLEEELDYKFWKNTAFNFEIILQILTTVVTETTKMNLKLVEKYNKDIKHAHFYT